MAIDTSGKWWVGTAAEDIADYLKAYKAEGHEVHATHICKCNCGSTTFELQADPDEGSAQRICAACGTKHLICDSAEYWEDADPQSWTCTECQSGTCNLAVAFSHYEPEEGKEQDVRWISVGQRCTGCGALGCFVDWKVGYGPSNQFLDQT